MEKLEFVLVKGICGTQALYVNGKFFATGSDIAGSIFNILNINFEIIKTVIDWSEGNSGFPEKLYDVKRRDW